MASIVIKTIGGRQYRYLQWYEPGNRKPKLKYLEPVNPKYRRRGLTLGDILKQLLGGGISIGVAAAKGELGRKSGRAKASARTNPTAARPLTEDQWAVHRSTMSAGEWDRYSARLKTALRDAPDKQKAEQKARESFVLEKVGRIKGESDNAAKNEEGGEKEQDGVGEAEDC